eukprot:TRINITY_DN4031_c0_g1_i12.p1 TRINITY_DN4031_c0_g1~~TRINITY_DN4031_c0_g1_i12.p1  ORF type:complete len:119 (-),score=16.77 TRINITY_DN4031_c0_g1_i12:439-795(-)
MFFSSSWGRGGNWCSGVRGGHPSQDQLVFFFQRKDERVLSRSSHGFVGFGTSELVAKYEADHDDYNSIQVKALADRLAEAFAEVLHAEVRKTFWGYSPEEELEATEMHKIKYQVYSFF